MTSPPCSIPYWRQVSGNPNIDKAIMDLPISHITKLYISVAGEPTMSFMIPYSKNHEILVKLILSHLRNIIQCKSWEHDLDGKHKCIPYMTTMRFTTFQINFLRFCDIIQIIWIPQLSNALWKANPTSWHINMITIYAI